MGSFPNDGVSSDGMHTFDVYLTHSVWCLSMEDTSNAALLDLIVGDDKNAGKAIIYNGCAPERVTVIKHLYRLFNYMPA